MTIDQLSFFHKYSSQAEPNIPMIDNSTKESSNIGVSLYPALMGTLNLTLQKVCIIFCVKNESSGVEIPFKTSYLFIPWNLPNPDDEKLTDMAKPLSAAEVTYKAIQEITTKTGSQTFEPKESDHYSMLIWAIGLSIESNPLDSTLPSDKVIMEAMNFMEKP